MSNFFSFQETNNDIQQQIEKLTTQNIQLVDELTRVSDQLKALESHHNEREQFYSTEKIQYEKHIKEISKRPIMTCVQLQTVSYSIHFQIHVLPFCVVGFY